MNKFLVHLTAPVTTTLSADNYRGEPRWERNCVDALLTQGKTVHTVWDTWKSFLPIPPGLHSGINAEWLPESTMITYGVPARTHIFDIRAKNYIVQYLDAPEYNTRDEFLQFNKPRPGAIVATCAFQSWNYIDKLREMLGSENVEWVQGPTVPYVVDDADNFNKKNLLWGYRNFCKYLEDQPPQHMRALLDMIGGFLSTDPEMRFTVTLTPYRSETHSLLVDPVDRANWFFSLPCTQGLLRFRDRIDLIYRGHWWEILDIMARTKLIVGPAEPLGGPPFEAGMFGIPTVVGNVNNPFLGSYKQPMFPELLTSDSGQITKQFMDLISRLFYDHSFYRTCGDAYRNHVKTYATYEAFVNQIDAIGAKRGWT